MFKAPARSKRRLRAEVGAAAGTAAAHLLACAREDADAWRGPVCYAPARAADAEWLAAHAGSRPLVILQRGANLGARLNHINRALRRRALDRQIYIGIDCPELTLAHLRAAERRLAYADTAIQPALDGGAVLIATRSLLPDLTDLPWSTPRLGVQLVALARAHGQSVAMLVPPLRDVDTHADLEATARALRTDRRPARQALRAFVAALRGAPTARRTRRGTRV